MTDDIEQHRLAMQEEAIAEVTEENSKWTPVITRQDAEDDMSEKTPAECKRHSAEFARHEVWDRERDEKVTRLETIMEQHLKDYVDLRGTANESLAIGRKVLAKLENGITEKLDNTVDADAVREILRGEQQGAKKRGREWLMALTAVCAIATAVLGLVL